MTISQSEINALQRQSQRSLNSLKPLASLKPLEEKIAVLKKKVKQSVWQDYYCDGTIDNREGSQMRRSSKKEDAPLL